MRHEGRRPVATPAEPLEQAGLDVDGSNDAKTCTDRQQAAQSCNTTGSVKYMYVLRTCIVMGAS